MRIATYFFFVVATLVNISAMPQQTQPTLPTTDAGRQVTAYIQAFNSPNEEAMREFFLAYTAKSALQQTPVEQRLSRFRQMKQRLGTLTLLKVLDSSPTLVSALFKRGDGGSVQLDYEFENDTPHGLMGIRVMDVDDGARKETGGKPMESESLAIEAAKAFLDSLSKADEFSGVVLVAKEGKPVFEKAYGFANREKKIPNNVDTKFNIGSINKAFTTIAIHQLAAEGKLSLKETIGKYFPDYPNAKAAQTVTIQHLLDMSSGIGDFFGERYQGMPKENLRTIRSYLPLFADKPLNFEPGSRRQYSNGGYLVLGAIIENVSGQDYYTYVREHIFKTCGMAETESYEKDKEVRNRALGYTREGAAASTSRLSNYTTLPARGSSAGGGYSTVHDLLKWIIAMRTGALKSPEAVGGFAVAGGAPGLNAAVEWGPRSRYDVIVLSNYDPPSAETVAQQIRSWLPR